MTWLLWVLLVSVTITKCHGDTCSSTPCLNGGTCIAGSNSYNCICTAAFTGIYCQTDIAASKSGETSADSYCPAGGLEVRGTGMATSTDLWYDASGMQVTTMNTWIKPTVTYVQANGHRVFYFAMTAVNATYVGTKSFWFGFQGADGSLYNFVDGFPTCIVTGSTWDANYGKWVMLTVMLVPLNARDANRRMYINGKLVSSCTDTDARVNPNGGNIPYTAQTLRLGGTGGNIQAVYGEMLWVQTAIQISDSIVAAVYDTPTDPSPFWSSVTYSPANNYQQQAIYWRMLERWSIATSSNVLISNNTLANTTTVYGPWVSLIGRPGSGSMINGLYPSSCYCQPTSCPTYPNIKCRDGLNSSVCSCFAGYIGSVCQTNIDECASAPCYNGGTCIDGSNAFTCSCQQGFSGTLCGTDVNECASAPCANGGSCHDGVNSFSCTCATGYTGPACQTNINECSSQPCSNGGTCTDGVDSFTCSCRQGFVGLRCQTDANECASNPCQNGGTCVDGLGLFNCTCPGSWVGAVCEIAIDCTHAPMVLMQPFLREFPLTLDTPYTLEPSGLDGKMIATATRLFIISEGYLLYHFQRARPNDPFNVFSPDQFLLVHGQEAYGFNRISFSATDSMAIVLNGGFDVVLYRSPPSPDTNWTSVQILRTHDIYAFGVAINENWIAIVGETTVYFYALNASTTATYVQTLAVPSGIYASASGITFTPGDCPNQELFIQTDPSMSVYSYNPSTQLWAFTRSIMHTAGVFSGIQSIGAQCNVVVYGGGTTAEAWPTIYSIRNSSGIWSDAHVIQAPYSDCLVAPVAAIDNRTIASGCPDHLTQNGDTGIVTVYSLSDDGSVASSRVLADWCSPSFARGLDTRFGSILASHGGQLFVAAAQALDGGGVSRRTVYQFGSPCESNAGCQTAGDTCITGYDNRNLQTCLKDSYCMSHPCQYGGNCTNQIGSYACQCNAGMMGAQCQTDVDECSSGPCANGGSCHDGVNSFICVCATGYTGVNCQTNINECSSQPCSNGGTCTDGVNSFTCSCQRGFSGTTCGTNNDECASAPCQNGGTCVDGIDSYSCRCAAGYEGMLCGTEVDECASNPCTNGGSCADGLNLFTCACPVEFTGVMCQTDINECSSNPCEHGGTCQDGFGSFVCICAHGFVGVTCQTDENECASLPCVNGGTCVDGPDSYTCMCGSGFQGQNCQTQIFACASQPCQNGASCIDGTETFACQCPDGFEGETCQTDIDECASAPCANGGTCYDDVNSFTCSCQQGFSGTTCGTDVDECASQPCSNGGTCTDGVNSFACSCQQGFSGTTCGTDNDECASGPCQNGGTCVDGPGLFNCTCPASWVGAVCEIPIDCTHAPMVLLRPINLTASDVPLTLEPSYDSVHMIATRTRLFILSESWQLFHFQRARPDDLFNVFSPDEFYPVQPSSSQTRFGNIFSATDSMAVLSDSVNINLYHSPPSPDVNWVLVQTITSDRVNYIPAVAMNENWIAFLKGTVWPPEVHFYALNTSMRATHFQTLVEPSPASGTSGVGLTFTPGDCPNQELFIHMVGLGVRVLSYDPSARLWAFTAFISYGIPFEAYDSIGAQCNVVVYGGTANPTAWPTMYSIRNSSGNWSDPHFIQPPYSDCFFTAVAAIDNRTIASSCPDHVTENGDTGIVTVYSLSDDGSVASSRILTDWCSPSFTRGLDTRFGSILASSGGQLFVAAAQSLDGEGVSRRTVYQFGSPCQNNTGCQTVGDTCITGYDNRNLQTCLNDSYCASHPCQYGGNCTDHIGSYSCQCNVGLTGAQCQTDVNECASAPCENGGSCYDGVNSFTCTCAAGYIGATCQTDVDECASAPCSNGGTCIDGTNSFTCSCRQGFSGALCGTDVDECASNPCQNGGTCVDEPGLFTCTCPASWVGAVCEIAIDCTHAPMVLLRPSEPEAPFTLEPPGGGKMIATMTRLFIASESSARLFHLQRARPDDPFNAFSPDQFFPVQESLGFDRSSFSATDSAAIVFDNALDVVLYRSPPSPDTNWMPVQTVMTGRYQVQGVAMNENWIAVVGDTVVDFYALGASTNATHVQTLDAPSFGFSSPSGVTFTPGDCPNQELFIRQNYINPGMLVFTFNPLIQLWAFTRLIPNTGDGVSNMQSIGAQCNIVVYASGTTSSAWHTYFSIRNSSSGIWSDPHVIQPPYSDCLVASVAAIDNRTIASSCPDHVTKNGDTGIVTVYSLSDDDSVASSRVLTDWCSPSFTRGLDTRFGAMLAFHGGQLFVAAEQSLDEGGVLRRTVYQFGSPCESNAGCQTAGDTCITGYDNRNLQTCLKDSYCASHPCQYGGNCTDLIGSYACQCNAGLMGAQCQSSSLCVSQPCANGATCNIASGGSAYSCTCTDGYSGNECRTDIDECASSPCSNAGTCIDGIASYICACSQGYTGRTCQTDVDECASNPCTNGGSCADGPNLFTCTCAPGWLGTNCTLIDECESGPCQNGATCNLNDTTGVAKCSCAAGFMGGRCQLVDGCVSAPCLHGATCTPLPETGEPVCACSDPWKGTTCNMSPSSTAMESPGITLGSSSSSTAAADLGDLIVEPVKTPMEINAVFTAASALCTAIALLTVVPMIAGQIFAGPVDILSL